MADSWEDWDDDAATPAIPTAAGREDVNAKFVGEDEEEEAPKWEGTVPKTQAVSCVGSTGATWGRTGGGRLCLHPLQCPGFP